MRSVACAAALALAACSSEGGGEAPADASPALRDARIDAQDDDRDAAAPAPDARVPDPDPDPGAPAPLYPLAVGNVWTYEVERVGASTPCAPGTHDTEVTGAASIGGRAAFQVRSFCAAAGTSNLSQPDSGDRTDFYYLGAWHTFIDPVLEPGHSWAYVNTRFVWERPAAVTVPAGTFEDCWTARQVVAYTAYTTYCRGVGVVQSYSADGSGAGWDARLASWRLE